MKKIILSVLSLVLMIACLVVGVDVNSTVTAGAGMGPDHKVKDVEELADILKFLLFEEDSEDLLGTNSGENKILTLLSTKDVSLPRSSSSSKDLDDKYTSATVTIITDQKSSSHSTNPKYSSGVRSASSSLSRELTMYINEDATLYQSKGTFDSSTEKENDNGGYTTSSISFDFDMQIMTLDEEDVYFKFKNFSFEDHTESRQIKYSNVNKWIELPEELVEYFVDIDAENRDVLNALGEILNHLIEAGEIEEEDTFIVLDEYDLATITSDLEYSYIPDDSLDDVDINFSYDLSSPTTPYISLLISYDSEVSREVPSYTNGDYYVDAVSITNTGDSNSQIMIGHINNTVVSFDENSVDIKVKTDKDFDKLFVIEERSTDDE